MKGIKNNRVRIDYKDMIRLLDYLGFKPIKGNKSNHIKYKNRTNQTVPLPGNKGTIPAGLLSTILRELELEREDLLEFIHYGTITKVKNSKLGV